MSETGWAALFAFLNGVLNLATIVYVHHIHADVHSNK